MLDETERWTGNAELVKELEAAARAALEWIDRHGDADGDGYVEDERRNIETGLENQCWKDSWDSIRFADGRIAEGPIATCEIQGYVYDAKVRTARLARELWDDRDLAERLDREAEALKRRFNEHFWLDERRCYALGLARYGYREEAARIALAILEAATFFPLSASGGLRRLPARAHRVPGPVPDCVEPSGVGVGHAARAAPRPPRPRARWRRPRGRSRPPGHDRSC